MQQLIGYSHDSQVVSESKHVESECNDITFINIGTDTATVLGYPILKGQQLFLPGSVGEICHTNFVVSFAGVSADKRLLIIRKIYQ